APDDRQAALELDAQANAAYEAGAYESAARLFQQAHELTGDPNYLYNISACYDRLGRLSDALEALESFAQQVPDFDAKVIEKKRRSLQIRIEKESREATRGDETAPTQDSTRPAAASSSPASRPDDDSGERRHPHAMDAAGGTLLALGGVGLITGLGLGLASRRSDRRAEDACADGAEGALCPKSAEGDLDKAKSFALGADVAFGVGGALAVAGVTMLVVSAVRAKRGRAGNSALAPAASPHGAGLAWIGRF
ncbi:MAG: hypothetical protein JNK45_06970, partial [Myxococcales bacterium]|nr:hypothetical protein [Myxococcales bacterium]